jgi:hypothetical protein
MPLWLPPNALGPTQTNLTAADRNGTTITAGSTAHVKGAYSAGQLLASTDEDTYGITVCVSGIHVSAVVTSYLLDIGIGVSGSEVDLIQDLDCWGANTVAALRSGPKYWYFPVFIPKGTRIAARAQALAVSDVANVGIWLHQAIDGWGMEVPVMWERLGAVTNSNGVSVTPSAGAFGSWTTILDPITKNYSWWHVGLDALADISTTSDELYVEIGFGDTSAAVTTIGSWLFHTDTGEGIYGPVPSVPVYQQVVDDDAKGIFARIAGTGTEARGILVYAGE